MQAFEASIRGVIEGLPSDYRQIHQDCFGLMLHAKKKPTMEPEDEELELLSCGRSLVEPAAQRARSILFVRQLAERVCLRRPPAPRDLTFVIDRAEPELADLRREFVGQNHPRARVVDRGSAIEADGASFLFHRLDVERSGELLVGGQLVACSEGISTTLPDRRPPVIFHRPAPGLKNWDEKKARPRGGATMLVELATEVGSDEATLLFFDYLTEFDAAVICSRPKEHFACDIMAMAFLAPLAAFIATGGSVATVRRSLHDFGFLQMPWELSDFVELSADVLDGLAGQASPAIDHRALHAGVDALLRGEGGEEKGEVDETLVEAMIVSLLQAVDELLSEGVLAHTALADVIAAELLGFPIAKGTLCQFVTTERVSQTLVHRESLEELVSTQVLEHAEVFRQNGRAYYV
ncbi:MAG: hypothetical protein ACNA8W_17490 [Bradymonadaceae bacterium]